MDILTSFNILTWNECKEPQLHETGSHSEIEP